MSFAPALAICGARHGARNRNETIDDAHRQSLAGPDAGGAGGEYTRYLDEAGVRKIAAIPGNRGVQMLRGVNGAYVEFQVLSYWDSLEAIKLFAGEDIERVNHLPRDPEYMVGPPPVVRHFEVIVNDWTRS